MSVRTLPGTQAAYIDMVKDALFEVGNLRAVIEYDVDEMVAAGAFIDDLEMHVKVLLAELEAGTHEFQDVDLPYMTVVRGVSSHYLPFKLLLDDVNAVHRKGLDE